MTNNYIYKLNKIKFFKLKKTLFNLKFYILNLIKLKSNQSWKFNLIIYENKKFKLKEIKGLFLQFKKNNNQIWIKNELKFLISLNSPQIKNFKI